MTTLYVDNIAPNLQSRVSVPGHVIQVVQGDLQSKVVINSGTYGDTGLSASITPSSTNNSILVIYQLSGEIRYDDTGAQIGYTRIVRNTTDLVEVAPRMRDANNSSVTFMPVNMVNNYLDSPSSTSSVTYKIQAKVENTGSNGEMIFNDSAGHGQITLLEIAG